MAYGRIILKDPFLFFQYWISGSKFILLRETQRKHIICFRLFHPKQALSPAFRPPSCTSASSSLVMKPFPSLSQVLKACRIFLGGWFMMIRLENHQSNVPFGMWIRSETRFPSVLYVLFMMWYNVKVKFCKMISRCIENLCIGWSGVTIKPSYEPSANHLTA